jgi:hypothetical protein
MGDYQPVGEPDQTGLRKSPSKSLKQSFQLYTFETIPEYLQSNPYIRTGYRCGLTVKECLIRYSILSTIKSLLHYSIVLVYSI